jgi:two-component system response regulator AtoC
MTAELNQSFRVDPTNLPAEAVIFGCSPVMLEIRRRIEPLSSSDLPVLIQGESGTGKEVIARFLHTRSSRSDALFVKLNCAAIPASLLESELFGYEKGAFTGANNGKAGLVEIADGGSLFLDEIGEMEWSLQGKLLQLLQDGRYTRIGGSEEHVARIRVICASKFDLHRAVEQGRFRDDLFYRIDVVCLRLPALRDRKEDIPQLCDYLLQKLSRQFNRPAPRLSLSTVQALKQWNWPGNLRELENWIARAIVFGEEVSFGAELRPQQTIPIHTASRYRGIDPLKEASRRATSAAASAIILKTLQANHWNRRKTAEQLKMSYRSLLYKLREVGVPLRRRAHRGLPPGR